MKTYSFRAGSSPLGVLSLATIVLVAGIFLGALPASAAGTTYYVGTTNCSDTGSGQSPSAPFCTIKKAASTVLAGQTVIVAGGIYAGDASVTHSGSAGSPITITAADGATVTINSGTNGFAVSSKAYVVVNGFSVTGTTSYGISVRSSDHITITNNTVTYSGMPVKSKTAAGIYLNGVSASTVDGNSADHNSDSGIYLTGGTTTTLVSNNEASFNAQGYQRNANGINVISPGNTILRNVLHDNEDSGIQFYPGGNDNVAMLNVSYNNGDHGVDNYNVTGGRLVGNTIYHNCTTGINVEGTSGNYVVKNNIAVDNAVYPAYNGIKCSRRDGNIGIWDSAPPTTVVDHNLVYLTTPGTLYVFGSKFTALSAMKAATGQEQYGIQADPKLASTATGDLRILPGSPAVDAATSAPAEEQSTDILGNPRIDVPGVPNTSDPASAARPFDDIGAYELQDTTIPPSAPTAALSVSPSSGQPPLAVTADASGSSDPQGQALTYSFDFGDGTVTAASSTPTATHTYTTAGSFTVRVTVKNTAGLTGTASAAVTVTGNSGATPTYVAQIATNYSTAAKTTQSITVWRSAGVASGDTAVVTLNLTGTAPSGAVSATDGRGNSYAVASDVSDALGNRLVVLYGTISTALAVNDKITATFPPAATSRMIGDELGGVSALDVARSATGSGGTFSSGAVATSNTKEIVFGVVGSDGGAAPGWGAGWTALTAYAVNSSYVGRGIVTTTSSGSYAANGTVAGNWLASVVSFR